MEEYIKNNGILEKGVRKLVIYNERTKKEIAVITHDKVTTADDVLVKLTFK